MATSYENVLRIERNSLSLLTSDLHLKGFGLNTDNKSTYFKQSNGTMHEYTALGGDAEYNTMKLTGLPSNGDIVGIDASGNLYKTSLVTEILDKNGFDNRTESAISYVPGTKVFTIELAAEQVSYGFYSDNTRFEYTAAHNVTLLASTVMQYIYFDGNGVLQRSSTFFESMITTDALVAIILLDGSGNVVGFGDERHGHVMASRTHMYLHSTIGMAFDSGLGLTGMSVDGTGNVDADAQFGVANGILWDEDNKIVLNDTVPQTMSPIIFLKKLWYNGTCWERTTTASYFPILTTGTGRAAYNDVVSGTLVEVTDGDFVLAHLFGSVDVDEPLEVMIGQAEYTTEQAAIAGAKTEIINLYTAGLIVAEMKFIATVLLKTKNTYTNAVKSKIISISDTEDYIDWRFTQFSPGGGVASESLWSRDAVSGAVYPLTIADNVGIGGIPTAGWGTGSVLEIGDVTYGANGSLFIKDADSNLYEGNNVYWDGTNYRRIASAPSILRRSGNAIYDIKLAAAGAADAIIDSLLKSRLQLASTGIFFNVDQENINTIFSSDTEVNALHIAGSTGFVGIHKSSPSYHLDMQDDSNIYTRITTVGNASVGLQLRRDEQLGSYNDNWIIRMDASSTYLNFWNGSNIMKIHPNGNVVIGPGDTVGKLTVITDTSEISGIEMLKDTVSTVFLGDGGLATEAKGALMLKESGSIKVYIGSSYDSYLNGGNLGIGTSNPLDDVGTAAGDFTGVGLHIKNDAANGTGYLIIEGEGAAANGSSGIGAAQIIFSSTIGAVGNKLYSISGGGDILTFNSINDDMSIKSHIMRLHNDGLVAINKSTDPSETLDVVGGVKIGSAENTNDGTMQWTGTDFEGRKSGTWVSLTGAGGSAEKSLTSSPYTFESTTTAPPSSGEIRYDNATQTSATKMYVHHSNRDGKDIEKYLEKITKFDRIMIVDAADAAKYQVWKVLNTTDFTSYTEYELRAVANGTSISDAADIRFEIIGGVPQYSMKVGLASDWATHSWEADELIELDTESYDDGSNFDTSTHIYTNGPTLAQANVSLNIRFSSSGSAKVKIMIKHGSTYVAEQSITLNAATELAVSCSCNVKLAASDTLSCYIVQTSGFALTVKSGHGTYFTVHKINE